MSKFGNLKSLVVDTNSRFTMALPEIGAKTALILAPAQETNVPYFRTLKKQAKTNAKRNRTLHAAGNYGLDVMRGDDKAIYPGYVIVGWEHMPGENKEGVMGEVPFSIEDCEEFLSELPNWVFDKIRGIAAEPKTFVALPEEVISEEDKEEYLKN
ncbi:MAG: hypothetical protein COB09_18510 [Thalassobium sp.]|nr:MAG: hypothetical protein COB09_18510 [Thalassobium sp.]